MAALDGGTIQAALKKLGKRLRLDHDVEILVVGGAAGLLTHELSSAWTTGDVDTMDCRLPEDRETVLDAAAEVGRELRLPASWLNDWAGMYGWTLPDGWDSRRILVGTHGRVQVYAVGRIDLIRMKFIAHRERDLEHLKEMKVKADEMTLVTTYLDALARRFPKTRYSERAGQIAMAKTYLGGWTGER